MESIDPLDSFKLSGANVKVHYSGDPGTDLFSIDVPVDDPPYLPWPDYE